MIIIAIKIIMIILFAHTQPKSVGTSDVVCVLSKTDLNGEARNFVVDCYPPRMSTESPTPILQRWEEDKY